MRESDIKNESNWCKKLERMMQNERDYYYIQDYMLEWHYVWDQYYYKYKKWHYI
jgi:hypothetical protein